ncbi:hypothetical protein V8E53_015352 [Lactarius tabidus]
MRSRRQEESMKTRWSMLIIDAPTELIPRQPIAPIPPPLQRRRATYDRRASRAPQPQLSAYNHPPWQVQQHVQDTNEAVNNTERDEDASLLGLPPSERNRLHHSRTQSSGMIGISVKPPVRETRRPRPGIRPCGPIIVLSPERAERQLPLAMPVQIPYIDIFSGSRSKPQSAPPHQMHARAGEDQERPFTLLPQFELAGLRRPRCNARTTPSALVRAQAGVGGCAVAPWHRASRFAACWSSYSP